MAFTVESLEPSVVGPANNQPKQFDLPSKEFVGYDPKGATTITGSPISDNKPANLKQADNIEAPVETQQETQVESVSLSPKVSAIARKEQQLRQQARALEQQKKEMADTIAAGQKYLSLQKKIEAKDYSGIDELGLSSNELASYEVDKLASQDPNEQRSRKLEEEIAALKKQQEERQIEEYEQNQALWKEDISDKLVKDVTKFPRLNKLKSKGQDAEAIVLQLINDAFDEDGVRLTSEKALSLCEKELHDRATFYRDLLDEEPTVSGEKVLGPPKTQAKTITQTMTTTPKSAPASKPFHLMSESEQIAEAIRRVQAAKLNR